MPFADRVGDMAEREIGVQAQFVLVSEKDYIVQCVFEDSKLFGP